ncbi:MAG: HD domain-containing protein [Candidatus Saganbacteria bacterium]|nr:HD domain-containing protein [Candidatus Saganbacteria bacterium]
MKHTQALKKLQTILPSDRFAHSLRVVKIAKALALNYNIEGDKVALAALLHDCSRFLSPAEMLKKANSLGFIIDEVERDEPRLLHAELSAYFAQNDYGIEDPEILSAIRSHTVGNTKMSMTDKIVYLADHIEDERDYVGLEKVKSLAFKNIDLAVIESLNSMIQFIKSLGKPVFHKTIASRDNLLGQLND